MKNTKIDLQELLKLDSSQVRDIIKDENVLNYVHSLITLKVSNSPLKDFYIFNNIIHGLNFSVPDFANFDPCSPEELWNGLHIIHKNFPDFEYSNEVLIYITSILAEDGIYFMPPFLGNTKTYQLVKERMELGPFPLEEDLIGIQASKLLALEMYTKVQSTKPVEII
jgi:hypothetical protein